jgi:hypothetical protein
MSQPWEHAGYHLSHEVANGQPVISIHTHPINLEALSASRYQEGLERTRQALSLPHPFTFESATFGYSMAGVLEESDINGSWTKVELPVPQAANPKRYRGTQSERLLPLVSTASAILRHLNGGVAFMLRDQDNPQYVEAWLGNSPDPMTRSGARISARLTPYMLAALEEHEAIDKVEKDVEEAIAGTWGYAQGDGKGEFGVSLEKPLRPEFDYPSDGGGFFAPDSKGAMVEGLSLIAANNDYPIQQIAILSGLAKLNSLVLQRSKIASLIPVLGEVKIN